LISIKVLFPVTLTSNLSFLINMRTFVSIYISSCSCHLWLAYHWGSNVFLICLVLPTTFLPIRIRA
jgi:hypothetical protein